jgi:hypothetical protein
MTSLVSARRRAEEFAAAVDGTGSIMSADLEQLVGVATALRTHANETALPRPEFAADLRARLMAEAEQALAPSAPLVLPVRQRGARERRLVAAASAVVLIGGTASMAAAAQQALPGEALYPIKRGLERAEAGLSVSTAGKGRDLLHQANDRLDEVEGLLAGGSVISDAQVPQTLEDFSAQAREGSGLLLTSYRDSQDPAAIDAVREFTSHGIAMLQDLARTAPPDAQEELAAAALALRDIDARANALCAACADGVPPLQVPSIFLAAAEAGRALTLVDGRFELLDNSHPVPVPRAILDGADEMLVPGPQDDTGSAEPTGPTGSPPAAATPTPGLGLPLPGGSDISVGGKDVKKVPEDATDGITKGLNKVVETLFPDAGLGPVGQ